MLCGGSLIDNLKFKATILFKKMQINAYIARLKHKIIEYQGRGYFEELEVLKSRIEILKRKRKSLNLSNNRQIREPYNL